MALRFQQVPQFQLTLTPALRLSLEVLQMPLLELQAYLSQQMEENPLLETTEETMLEPERIVENLLRDKLNDLDESYRDLWRQADGSPADGNNDDELPPRESIARPPTLYEHVASQLRCALEPGPVLSAAQTLLLWLDPDGYLRTPIEDIAQAESLSVDHVQQALTAIQHVDPPGVGARNLRECLLIQLRQRQEPHSLAERIIRDHFDLFAKRKMRQLASRIGATMDDIQSACRLIARLDPRPARAFSSSDPAAGLVPDLVVHRAQDEFHVELNDDAMPRIHLSSRYRSLLRSAGTPTDAKLFIRQKLRQGVWLLKAINQRHTTLLAVAKTLVKLEHEYLLRGVSHLKPLTQEAVAQIVGCHASTVSRAIAGKTIQTPHGILPLAMFFGGGIARPNEEESLAPKTIQAEIGKLIASEDPAKPLSDQALADALRARGFPVARRTIAKYRSTLKLLPAHLRKRCF